MTLSDNSQDFKPSKKLADGDFYLSEEGFVVFTAQYHLKRGYCCKSGCKHCPYGYDKKTGNFVPKSTPQ